MNDNRNMILAIVLAGLILFGWPVLQNTFFPAPHKPVASKSVGKDAAATPVADVDAPAAPTATVPLASALKSGPRLIVETPKLKGSIALTGAKIDDMVLTQHRKELNKNSPDVRLLSPSGTKGAYFGAFGWTGTGVDVPTLDTVWTASATKLTPETPVTLSWKNATGQTFEIALSIDKDYLITAEQRVVNGGTDAIAVTPYGLISRKGISPDPSTWTIHVGPMGVFDGSADYDWNYEDVAEAPGGKTSFQKASWVGFTDHYWLTALIPDQKRTTSATFRHGEGDIYQTQIVGSQSNKVAPGATLKQTSRLFVGAKEVNVLDDYTDRLGIAKFDYAIDWGWYRPIIKLFFYIIDWLFDLVGNFGLAIIGLTLLVRAVLFPIAQKQFASMASMRAIQPKQKEIQERFKDDKARQQQEIMKLYKEEKVNPLAGCLPIFLQIPIFFALYKLLMLTIDMRHQPFALWIKDLSAPDPMTPVNLFGLLPFTPPSFLAIGVLPILVGFTMWLQQKLNPQVGDPVQQQVFALMPWMLMFVMAPFAAGLQLYWATNNIVSIAQQKLLYARHPQMKASMEKEAADKAKEKAKGKSKGGA